jgi:hypothetical protein
MKWWAPLLPVVLLAAACGRDAPGTSRAPDELLPARYRTDTFMAVPAQAPRLSAETVESIVRAYRTASPACGIAGPPPETCTVGMSALIDCNAPALWLAHGINAPDPVPARFAVSWDADHGRWDVESTCAAGANDAVTTRRASFWYYESGALVPLDDRSLALFTGHR